MATSFGAELRDERERLGLTLNQAYQATRVRVEILNAFENEDIEAMPPRGYSMNMIASYARWLGLDPRVVIKDYQDAYDAYESSRTFDDDPYNFYGSKDASDLNNGQNRRPRRYQRSFTAGESTTPSYRHDYNTYGADEAMNSSHYDANTTRRLQSTRIGNTGGKNGRASRSSRIFSGNPRGAGESGTGRSKIVVIAIAIVLIIIIGIVLATVVKSCSSNSNTTLTPTTSVDDTSTGTTSSTTGATGTSTTTTTGSSGTTTQTGTTTTTTALAAPFTISFTVADGQSSNIVVDVNGQEAYNANALSGETQSFSVSTSVSMTVSNPDAVTVYKDGVQIPMTLTDGVGHIDMSVTAS